MTTPRISVVVAFFNNEDDLGDCLDSIAAQTHPDLEVIMVDDGSSDHSAEIARAKAAADPRFSLLQPEHGGPGGARNRGVERARGEYLAFVDGDDVLPANAYELLLHALERSGSDFVSGAVNRVGPKGITPSALHSLALVASGYGLPARHLGTVSLIGPVRMDYGAAIRTVREAARQLSRFIEDVYET